MTCMTMWAVYTAIGGCWVRAPADLDEPLRGVTIDSREDVAHRAFFAIRGDRHDGHDFVCSAARGGARLFVVEDESAAKNVEGAVMCVTDARSALGMLAATHRRTLNGRVIAITGSSGKTTTKAILHAILKCRLRGVAAPKSFNNDIGVPLTLLQAERDDDYVILEVGTNAPGEIAALGRMAEPDIAVITMIGRSHMAGLGSIEHIAREKLSLLDQVRAGGVCVIRDDVAAWGERIDPGLRGRLRLRTFGAADLNDACLERFMVPGKHNKSNALAAIAVAREFGVDDEVIAGALSSVVLPAMRYERIAVGDVTVVNDAYNANPDSMLAAIETFAGACANAPQRVLVLGDMLELGDAAVELHEGLGDEVARRLAADEIDLVVLVGGLMRHAAERLGGGSVVVVESPSESAARDVAEQLLPGAAILLKGSRGMRMERFIDFWCVMLNQRKPIALSHAV